MQSLIFYRHCNCPKGIGSQIGKLKSYIDLILKLYQPIISFLELKEAQASTLYFFQTILEIFIAIVLKITDLQA